MATDDKQILVAGTAPTPADFLIPGNGQIQPKAVNAVFDGSGAASAFLPTLEIVSDAGVVVARCPAPSVAAGGSAEVSWFPRVGGGGSSSGGSGTSVPLLFGAPDAANGYVTLLNLANVRLLVPAFTTGVNSFWWGVLDVPTNYTGSGTIVIWVAAGSGAGNVFRWIVATNPVSTTGTWNVAPTAETAKNATVPALAYQPAAVSFTLSTTPVAGRSLVFYVERNGANAADTLTADAVLLKAVFTYT